MGKFFKIAKHDPVAVFRRIWNLSNKNYSNAAKISDRGKMSIFNAQINRLKSTDMGKALLDVDSKSFNMMHKIRKTPKN